jgi:UDP-N-acetylglucosamine:LPS N-acetylglucosamine transferase
VNRSQIAHIEGQRALPHAPDVRAPRFLLITARVGAGHTAVARELERRLTAEGAVVTVVDFLDALPARLGPAMAGLYRAQLRHAPWTYDLLYRLRFRHDGAWSGINAAYTALTRQTLLRWVDEAGADVVVSLYPLAATVVGRLRDEGALGVPAATFLTDFGVHPLWVHRAVDLHLAVHPQPAWDAAERTGGDTRTQGPVVRPGLDRSPAARATGRALLGVGADEPVVLVSGGSWAVGSLEETVTVLARSARYVPVVLCGHDGALRQRLAACGARALGWTEQVAEVLAASDVLVDNAGGQTCLEAFAAGVPVVAYAPIAGHGRHNAAEMVRAGLVRWPRTPAGLLRTLDELTTDGDRRDAAVAAASAMFFGDAAKELLDLVDVGGRAAGRAA